MSSDELWSLTQLVEHTQLSARTIRYYTTRGLLPAPARHGREVRYGPEHVVRLRLIRELTEHGLTLAAIEAYLERVPDDASPPTIELHRTLVAPWTQARPENLTEAELAERAGHTLDAAELDVLSALGIVTRADKGRYNVAVDRLTAGLAVCDLGVTPETAAAVHRVITSHGAAVADELTQVFRDDVWPSMRDSGARPEQLQAAVEHLKPVTVGLLIAAYESAMDSSKRETVERRSRKA